jgi:hypothetical protein
MGAARLNITLLQAVAYVLRAPTFARTRLVCNGFALAL